MMRPRDPRSLGAAETVCSYRNPSSDTSHLGRTASSSFQRVVRSSSSHRPGGLRELRQVHAKGLSEFAGR